MARKVRLRFDGNGAPVQGALSPDSTTKINFTDTSAINSTPFNAEVVRLIATQDCHVKMGGPGSASTTNDMLIKANQPEYFALRDQHIAVIRDSVNGTLYVTVMV